MDQKARKMQHLVAATTHMCHELDALAELEQPTLAPAPTALHQVAAGPSARVVWLGRGREVERLRVSSGG
jgi:hypothetical protein